MPAFFITSTGTDIGKTFVAAGLIRQLRNKNLPVDALKPVVSGFDPVNAATSDPGILLEALGRRADMEAVASISPWRFTAPLSPDLAARRENRALDFDALVTFSRKAVAAHTGTLFIEGAGGIMAPLDNRHTMIDWMTELDLPLILVAGSYLGTISHTLSALDALVRRKRDIVYVVISETIGSSVPLDDTLATIRRFAHPINMLAVPRLAAGTMDHPAFGQLMAACMNWR